MPMVPSVAGETIAASMVTELQKAIPSATATPFQKELSAGVAKGLIAAMKTMAKGAGAGVAPAAGPGTGITGVSADRMVSFAMTKFQDKVGSKGPAAEPIMTAIFKGMVTVLGEATVISISGFGGPVLSISNLDEGAVASLIFQAMPADTQASMSKSKHGMTLLEAIAHGFCKEVQAAGTATIPAGGTPPGPVVAMFS